MKFIIKFFFFNYTIIAIILFSTETFSKDTKFKYSSKNISNYFSGIVSLNQNYTTRGFKYLDKVKPLKTAHSNFNVQYIHSLVLLGKFDEAFTFSKSIWDKDELFFEIDLLLGLQSFIKKDYRTAEKYFERLNTISKSNLLFDNFFGNILITWIKASENNRSKSIKFFEKIPKRYDNLKRIQNSFLHCYFDTTETESSFKELIGNEKTGFSRYNFFLVNYLLSKNKILPAEELVRSSINNFNQNLLMKQVKNFIDKKNYKKITNLFNCNKPKENISEILYVVANMYSTQKNYKLSNFYLQIALFLNDKFTPNKTLLAENYFYLKKYELAKKIYNSIKLIGPIYSWYANMSLAMVLSETDGKKYSTSFLTKKFNLISNPNLENYYEFANFLKDNEYHEDSIKYYSLALKKTDKNHFLLAKILDRRGTSYERIGDWKKAEIDLKESLKILPDQAHVLNYLAYTWVEKRKNLDEAFEMLIKANELKENDGYIIDSLGWAYYVNNNYLEAEKYLRRAVEIMPSDPIVNDHYADTLWMLDKHIQARYFWKHILSLDDTEQQLKDKVRKKLIFGITKKL